MVRVVCQITHYIIFFFLHIMHFLDVQFVQQVQRRYPYPVPTDPNQRVPVMNIHLIERRQGTVLCS
jgi:hypothetical protein